MDPDRPVDEPHVWARKHLARLYAGLLEPAEEERLRAHLAGCEGCRGAAATLLPEPAGEGIPGDHLPPDLIARWPQLGPGLRGLERTLVLEHLARCADCREELELLGHEWSPAASPAGAPTGAGPRPDPARVPRLEALRGGPGTGPGRLRKAGGAARWTYWGLGGWASLATAAAVALLLRQPPEIPAHREARGGEAGTFPTASPRQPLGRGDARHPVETPGNVGSGHTGTALEAPEALLALANRVDLARGQARGLEGPGSEPRRVRLARGIAALQITCPVDVGAGAEDTARVAIRITLPSGRRIQISVAAAGLGPEPLVLTFSSGQAPPGLYRLRYSWRSPSGREQVVEDRFQAVLDSPSK